METVENFGRVFFFEGREFQCKYWVGKVGDQWGWTHKFAFFSDGVGTVIDPSFYLKPEELVAFQQAVSKRPAPEYAGLASLKAADHDCVKLLLSRVIEAHCPGVAVNVDEALTLEALQLER
jgi:hypothetical protein